MTKFIGALADVGIAKETVRGTPESSATYYLPKISFSYDDIIKATVDENTIGVIEDSVGEKLTHKAGQGEIEGKICDKSFGLLMLALFGTDTPSGPSDSAYTHTFSVAQTATHQCLTLFQEDPNQDYKYALAMLTKMEIAVELEKFATFKASFMSKAGATATLTPSYTAENNFLPQHGVFKIATTQSGLTAASPISIIGMKLNFEKNVEEYNVIGSTSPSDIHNKQFSADGEFEIVFDDETFKTLLLADTQRAIRLTLTNSDVLIGSSSVPVLQFDFHAVKFTEVTRNYGNNDIVTLTVKFKAFYNLTDSKMVTPSLVNAVASY